MLAGNDCHTQSAASRLAHRSLRNGTHWLASQPRTPALLHSVCPPVVGGALRRTSCGRWAHVVCCDYVPETHLDPDKGVIHGLAQVGSVCMVGSLCTAGLLDWHGWAACVLPVCWIGPNRMRMQTR